MSIDEKEIGIGIKARTTGFAEATRDVSGLDNAIGNMQNRATKAMTGLEQAAKQVSSVYQQAGGKTPGAEGLVGGIHAGAREKIDQLRKMGYTC